MLSVHIPPANLTDTVMGIILIYNSHGPSGVPGVHEVSIGARPPFVEAGVLAIPTLLEKSAGCTVVGRAAGSLASAASKSLEAIIEAAAPEETPDMQTGPTPKELLPIRTVKAYIYLFTFPIRFLFCSAKPACLERGHQDHHQQKSTIPAPAVPRPKLTHPRNSHSRPPAIRSPWTLSSTVPHQPQRQRPPLLNEFH